MKENVDIELCLDEIMSKVSKGILLTTKDDFKVNSMAISWGSIGRVWNKYVFIAFVKECRYTKEVLDKSGEFTVNIPIEKLDSEILRVCGNESGRDIDKISKLGLTLVESNYVNSPAIMEVPITLECKVIYQQKHDSNFITKENIDKFYSSESDFDNNYHTAYYGEIVDAYIIK